MSQKQKANEEEIDYAYKVIESFKKSFDEALVNDMIREKVFSELLGKFGTLLEAIVIITEVAHKQVIGEMAMSYLRMVKEWTKTK